MTLKIDLAHMHPFYTWALMLTMHSIDKHET